MKHILIILGLAALLSGCSGGSITIPVGKLLFLAEQNTPVGEPAQNTTEKPTLGESNSGEGQT